MGLFNHDRLHTLAHDRFHALNLRRSWICSCSWAHARLKLMVLFMLHSYQYSCNPYPHDKWFLCMCPMWLTCVMDAETFIVKNYHMNPLMHSKLWEVPWTQDLELPSTLVHGVAHALKPMIGSMELFMHTSSWQAPSTCSGQAPCTWAHGDVHDLQLMAGSMHRHSESVHASEFNVH